MTPLEDFKETLTESERDYIVLFQKTMKEFNKTLETKATFNSAILWKGEVVQCDFMTAIFWQMHHQKDCIINKTTVKNQEVSTCFLTTISYDGNYFETMIFGKTSDVIARYKTLKEAEEGHKNTVASLL